MKLLLDGAAFKNQRIREDEERDLDSQGRRLIERVERLVGDHDHDDHGH